MQGLQFGNRFRQGLFWPGGMSQCRQCGAGNGGERTSLQKVTARKQWNLREQETTHYKEAPIRCTLRLPTRVTGLVGCAIPFPNGILKAMSSVFYKPFMKH